MADLAHGHLLTPHSGALEEGGRYEALHFDGLAYDDADAGNTLFGRCAFAGVTFTGGEAKPGQPAPK